MLLPRCIRLPATLSFFLFGPRQTGKSTLVDTVYRNRAWKVNLLLSDVFLAYEKSPEQFRRDVEFQVEKMGVRTVIVDEVQRLPGLLNEVHHLIEKYADCRFVLAGSSARKLRKGGTNLLAGRAVERHLHPFVYQELGQSFDLDDVLQHGTLPGVYGLSGEEKRDVLHAYVNTYLKEEVRDEGIVRKLPAFSRFLDVAAAQFGHQVNYSAIGREVGLSPKSVQSYFGILEDTLIAVRLNPWRKSLRKRLAAQPKLYFFDCGVTNAVNKTLSGGVDRFYRGRLFEQLIVLQTKYLLEYLDRDTELFYWRTSQGAEVDLLVRRRNAFVAAIEIKLSSRVDRSHLRGLRSLKQDYPAIPCYVVANTPQPFSLGDVTVLPWQHYLRELSTILDTGTMQGLQIEE